MTSIALVGGNPTQTENSMAPKVRRMFPSFNVVSLSADCNTTDLPSDTSMVVAMADCMSHGAFGQMKSYAKDSDIKFVGGSRKWSKTRDSLLAFAADLVSDSGTGITEDLSTVLQVFETNPERYLHPLEVGCSREHAWKTRAGRYVRCTKCLVLGEKIASSAAVRTQLILVLQCMEEECEEAATFDGDGGWWCVAHKDRPEPEPLPEPDIQIAVGPEPDDGWPDFNKPLHVQGPVKIPIPPPAPGVSGKAVSAALEALRAVLEDHSIPYNAARELVESLSPGAAQKLAEDRDEALEPIIRAIALLEDA